MELFGFKYSSNQFPWRKDASWSHPFRSSQVSDLISQAVFAVGFWLRSLWDNHCYDLECLALLQNWWPFNRSIESLIQSMAEPHTTSHRKWLPMTKYPHSHCSPPYQRLLGQYSQQCLPQNRLFLFIDFWDFIVKILSSKSTHFKAHIFPEYCLGLFWMACTDRSRLVSGGRFCQWECCLAWCLCEWSLACGHSQQQGQALPNRTWQHPPWNSPGVWVSPWGLLQEDTPWPGKGFAHQWRKTWAQQPT